MSINLDRDLEDVASRVDINLTGHLALSGSGPAAQVLATLLLVQAVRDLSSDIRAVAA